MRIAWQRDDTSSGRALGGRHARVLAVGARLSGQASFSTRASRTTSASRASADCVLPVTAISLAPSRFTNGTIRISSSLSPEYEIATRTSGWRIMPRSPWLASAGWTKYAGVPVLDNVDAILRAIWPDLP